MANNQVNDPYAKYGGVSMGSTPPDPTQADSAVPSQVNPAPVNDPYAKYDAIPVSGSAPSTKPADSESFANIPDVNKEFSDAEAAQGIELRDHLIGGVKGLVEGGYYTARGAQWLINKIASATPGMSKGVGEIVPSQEPQMLKSQNPAEARGKVIEGVLEFFMGDAALKSMGVADKLKAATGLAKMLEEYPNLARAFHIGTTMARTGVAQGTQALVHGATPKEAAIAAAETGVTAGSLETLGTVATSGAPNVVRTAARLGQAGVGAGIAIKGSKQALTSQQPGETPEQAATRQASGAVQAILGGASVVESAAEAGKAVKEAMATPLPTPEKAVGQVFNTAGEAREANVEAMKGLKGAGVKLPEQTTMPKMRESLETVIQRNTDYIDKVLGENERVYTPDELQERYPVPGRNDVKVLKPAQDALTMLEAHYDNTNNPGKAAETGTLAHKYKTEGLTLLELNTLARDFGSEFDNVYKRTQDQGYVVKDADQPIRVENVRQMLKRQVRERMPNEDLQKIDEQTSNLIKTRGDADKFMLQLEKLENRLPQTSWWKKASGKLGDAVSFVQGSFLQKLLKISPKETELNVADMAERMPKAMRVLDQLLQAKPDDMGSQIEYMVTPHEPAPKELEGQQAPASGSQIPANLALKWDEPYIEKTPRGWDTKAVLNHELGHAAVAHQVGFSPIDIWSDQHPQSGSTAATTNMDWAELQRSPSGHIDPAKLKNRLFDMLTTVFGGAAANELYDDIPFHENQGLKADKEHAQELLKLLGVEENDRDLIIGDAMSRAKSLLSDPKVSDVVNEFSDTREPNLPKTHHYSAARMLEFVDRIDEARNAGNETRVNERGLEHGAGSIPEAAAGNERGVAAAAGASKGLGATAVSVPEAISTGEYDSAIKKAGAIPGGLEKGDADANVPDMVLFHDPTTGSTLYLPTDSVSVDKVKAELEKSRAQFAAKPQAGEKQAKIEGAELKGHPEWTQASLEREITRAKSILRNPDATAEEKEYAQSLLDTSRELQKNPALANLHAKDKRESGNLGENYGLKSEEANRLRELFTETDTPNFIMPDGKTTDPSDGSHIGHTRYVYHGPERGDLGDAQGDLDKFIKTTGAIRVLYPEFTGEKYPVAEFMSKPTSEQIQKIAHTTRNFGTRKMEWNFPGAVTGRQDMEFAQGSIGDFQRAIEKRWPPTVEPEANKPSPVIKGPSEDVETRILSKGSISPKTLDNRRDFTHYLLANGDWTSSITKGGPAAPDHLEVEPTITRALGDKAKGMIRSAGGNSFDITSRPTEAQRSEISRISKESDGRLTWDLYPSESGARTLEGAPAISGTGSIGDFLRTIDKTWPIK